MTPELAQQVVVGITLVGAVIWLLSLNFLWKSTRLLRPLRDESFEEPPSQNCLTGSAEIDGDAATLTARATAVLAKGILGTLKIVTRTNNRIVFERVDPGVAHQPAGRWFRRGELRFTPRQQNRTRIEWTVEPGSFQRLMVVGGLFQVVGLVALIVGCWALFTFVASSPNPAVRWQSFQMCQTVHVLWPPFLFAGLYRKGITGIAAEFDALAHNLPYLGDQT